MKEQSTPFQDPSTSPEVQLAYNQLHSVIDNLDTHVQQLIRRHQSQFILAYRNHLIKVKDQLAILKKKSEEQERLTSGVTKINKLERQVALFREEALKVYAKLEEKTKECEEYKAKYVEGEENNVRSEDVIKDLTRRLKNTEVRNKELEAELFVHQREQENEGEEVEQRQQLENKEKASYPISAHRSMRMTGMITQSNQSIQQILRSIFPTASQEQHNTAYQKIHKIITDRQAILSTRLQGYKNKQLMAQAVDSAAMTSDLKQWFLQCIKVVKKEILKRNPNIEKEKKVVENVKNIDEFLRIDKLRLLELFISNEKLLSVIYNKLFPDRMAEIQQFLLKKQHEPDQNLNSEQVHKQSQSQFLECLEDIEKPKVILPKAKKPKQSIGNRVIIKNGKLNLKN